jgi:enediyne biosynthesis protein E4
MNNREISVPSRHGTLQFWQRALTGCVVLCFIALAAPLKAQTVHFTDITASKKVKGLLIDGRSRFGHGVAFADISGDGLADLYVSNASEGSIIYPEVLYISHAGKSYSEESVARGVTDNYGIGSHGLVFFDMDNDGDYDLFNGNTYQQPYDHAYNRLYQNNGQGVFKDVTAGVGLPVADTGTRSVAVFDANNDGWMDLFAVGSKTLTYLREPYYFYLNQGNGTFQYADLGTATMAEDGFGPNGLTIADYDNDGDQEIYISRVDRAQKGARARNQLLDKQANGRYIDKAESLGVLGAGWSDGATFADYDNDGDLDLFVASSYDKKLRKILIYSNNGNGTFTNRTDDYSIYQRGFSTLLFDADNDGDLDLWAISKDNVIESNCLYLNDGAGQFNVVQNTGLEVRLFDPRGVAVADVDQDGDLDIYAADTNKADSVFYGNHLFRNDLSSTNRWLKITGRGPQGDLGGFCSKIHVFEKAHMDDGNYLVGYKQIISNYGFCCQDDPVQHFGLGQRDTVAVKITLTDGTVLKMARVAAGQKIQFSKPTRLQITGGDAQTALAGETLALPLTVKVRDALQQPVYGAAVRFSSADGRIVETQPIYTDSQGMARVHYVVGDGATTQHILASLPLTLNAQVDFTALKKPAPVVHVPKEINLISSQNPTGQAGAFLTDSVKVRVFLDDGSPCAGQAVAFAVLAEQGSIYPGAAQQLERTTNSQGFAAVAWKLGAQSGAVLQQMIVQAIFHNAPLAGSPLTISAQAVFPDTLQIKKISGDGQSGPANAVLPLPVTIKLVNSRSQSVPNQRICFHVESGGGLVADADSVTVITQPNGQARVFWRLGPAANAVQSVSAFVADQPDKKVVFTAAAYPTAAKLVYSGPAVFSGVVNRALADSVTVQVTDEADHPVAMAGVLCEIITGKGTVNGCDSVRLITDVLGYARCQWRLGPVAGYSNNHLRISATGLTGSPVLIAASAVSGQPFRIIKKSGDQQTSLPNRTLPLPLQVLAVDSTNNPAPNCAVVFLILQGDGDFNGVAQINAISDSCGLASAVLHVNHIPGSVLIRAVAYTDEGPLQGSPLVFSTTTVLPEIDCERSRIICDSLVVANGRETGCIQVTLIGKNGQPLPDLSVQLHATGLANTLRQPQTTTDQQGVSTGYLASTCAEIKKVWLEILYSAVTLDTLAIRFKAGEPASLSKVSGDEQVGPVRMPLAAPVVVALTDSFYNPVSGQSLQWLDLWPDGSLHVSAAITDVQGLISRQWIMGSFPGLYRWSVYGPGLTTVTFKARALQRNPTTLTVLSGGQQSGRPGTVLPLPLAAQIGDEWGEAVVGAAVRFMVTSGGGVLLPPTVVTSDSGGKVQVWWRLGKGGMQTVSAILLDNESAVVTYAAELLQNHQPVILCPVDTTCDEGVLFSLLVSAHDEDGDSVTITARDLPDGASYNINTRQFLWRPGFQQAGTWRVSFQADDGHDGLAATTMELVVRDVARPLTLLHFSPQDTVIAIQQRSYSFSVQVENPDNRPCDFSWWLNGEKLPLVGADITWQPPLNLPQPSVLLARVSDGVYTIEQQWRLQIFSDVTDNLNRPVQFALVQNYPNPFNPSTRICFSVAKPGLVDLEIYDSAGKYIRSITHSFYQAGSHSLIWDARDDQQNPVSSGIYFCKMKSAEYLATIKLLFIK